MRRGSAALLVTLALAGCGGSAKPPAAAKPPLLPHALAQTLAMRANAVAQALERGDGCTALADATGLQNAVAQAIAAHEVPVRLQPTLSATADSLTIQAGLLADTAGGDSVLEWGSVGGVVVVVGRSTPDGPDHPARTPPRISAAWRSFPGTAWL